MIDYREGPAEAGAAGAFQYTGQVWLPTLGLYHYKARAYSPAYGRFLQTDPVGYDDQINLFAYVGNDPVNKVDPSGMMDCSTEIAGTCTNAKAPDDASPTEDPASRVTGASFASVAATSVEPSRTLLDAILKFLNPSYISEVPRPLVISDLGPTIGGEVWVAGEISASHGNLNIHIDLMFARGVHPGVSIVAQGLTAARTTAERMGLEQVVVTGSIANPALLRYLNTAITNIPGSHITTHGGLEYLYIPVNRGN